MKRTRGDSLTGGTGDVNPQLLTLTALTLTATDTFTIQQQSIPITRIPARGGKAVVMEVLKVYFDMPAPSGGNFTATGQTILAYVQLSTSRVGLIDSTDPNVFAFSDTDTRGAFTAGGSYAYTQNNSPVVIDLTDGAGHGLLVATDSLFFSANTVNYSVAATFVCKILYRFKEVKLEEYIGIVQSQQAPARWRSATLSL